MTSEPEFLDVCTMTTLAVVPPTHYPVTGYSSCSSCLGVQVVKQNIPLWASKNWFTLNDIKQIIHESMQQLQLLRVTCNSTEVAYHTLFCLQFEVWSSTDVLKLSCLMGVIADWRSDRELSRLSGPCPARIVCPTIGEWKYHAPLLYPRRLQAPTMQNIKCVKWYCALCPAPCLSYCCRPPSDRIMDPAQSRNLSYVWGDCYRPMAHATMPWR